VLLSRHVLEHVPDPGSFLQGLRPALSANGGGVYLEVPDATFTLRDRGIWDLIYEHCSYFTPASLSRLARAAGIEIDEVRGGEYGGQFLTLSGTWSGAPQQADADREAVDAVVAMTEGFANTFHTFVDDWSDRLAAWLDAGKRVAVWGMGSKGVTFLNLMPRGREVSDCVDLNPRKSGLYVPGTAQVIREPRDLAERPADERPDVVLVMNPLYQDEIRKSLADLGLEPEIHAVA
jgi:hypothetical protein